MNLINLDPFVCQSYELEIFSLFLVFQTKAPVRSEKQLSLIVFLPLTYEPGSQLPRLRYYTMQHA